MWPIAEPKDKKFKFFFSGPPGSYKTRLALRLADNGNRKDPATGIIDTEFGTDHYAGEFAFRRLQENDPDLIEEEILKLVKNPGNIKTLIIDSFSVYYDALMEKWVDVFQKREKTSAGNKGDYYTLQPRDYVHINRDTSKLIRILLKCDLNIICICQVKAEWGDNMKIIGSVFDGWKRLPYYFDTVINIDEDKKNGTFTAKVIGKDRSGTFKRNQEIPWESDQIISKYMIEKMGCHLSDGKAVNGYDPDKDKSESQVEKDAQKAVEEQSSKDTDKAQEEDTKEDTKKESEKEKSASSDSTSEDKGNSRLVDKPKLLEIVKEKKKAKVNNPDVWAKMLQKYDVTTAKDMTMEQADELIKDLIRGEIPT